MFKYWPFTCLSIRPLVYRAEPIYFSDFSTKTYDVGTLNSRFNETVLLAPKRMLNLMDKNVYNLRSYSIQTCELASVASFVVCCVSLNTWERWNGVELLSVNVAPFSYRSS